jgi:hypothetical protein
MYLTLKEPWKMVKPSKGAEPNIIEIDFDGKPMKAYLDAFEYRFLIMGKNLQLQGVGEGTLNQLRDLIEEYGHEM